MEWRFKPRKRINCRRIAFAIHTLVTLQEQINKIKDNEPINWVKTGAPYGPHYSNNFDTMWEIHDKILAEPYLKGGLDLGANIRMPPDLSLRADDAENLFLSRSSVQMTPHTQPEFYRKRRFRCAQRRCLSCVRIAYGDIEHSMSRVRDDSIYITALGARPFEDMNIRPTTFFMLATHANTSN